MPLADVVGAVAGPLEDARQRLDVAGHAGGYGIPAAPFGGKKNSGLGQVNGKKGMRGYCHEMPIVIDRFGGKMQNAYPYSAKSAEGMRKLMDFLWVKTPLGRWLS